MSRFHSGDLVRIRSAHSTFRDKRIVKNLYENGIALLLSQYSDSDFWDVLIMQDPARGNTSMPEIMESINSNEIQEILSRLVT